MGQKKAPFYRIVVADSRCKRDGRCIEEIGTYDPNLEPSAVTVDEEAAKNVLRRQHHINDVTPRNYVEVCIDLKQQGVGGYDSWGARPEPQYTLPANKDYQWGFTIIPE